MAIVTARADIERVLRQSRRVIILGASSKSYKAGFYVPEYLAAQGYQVQAVNPVMAGQELFGAPVLADLGDVEGEVDLLDVFRRSELLPAHVDDILALRPRVVWLQLGIRHDAVAEQLSAAGLDVVQDRCTLADHRAMGIGPVS